MVLSLIVIWCAACHQHPDVDASDLSGRWNIVLSERNGKKSEYLDRGYMHFFEDGRMTVNLTGGEETARFSIDDNIIRMDGHRDYLIERHTRDSLFVRFSTHPESNFRVVLRKDNDANR